MTKFKTKVSSQELRNVAAICGEQKTPCFIDTEAEGISVMIPEWNRTYVAESNNVKRDFMVLVSLVDVRKKKTRNNC